MAGIGPYRKPHRTEDGIEQKHCPTCDTWYPLEKFWKAQEAWDGKKGQCCECMKKQSAAWSDRNREKKRAASREWNRKHPEIMEATRKRQRLLYPERYRRDHNKACRKWLDTVNGALHNRMSNLVRVSLKRNKNRSSINDILGYTREELRKHLESTMPQHHTWDDFIAGRLHIDHIVPVTAFNFSSYNDLDFQKCWGLSNLRLLPAADNIKKSNHLDRPFQPSLAIAV